MRSSFVRAALELFVVCVFTAILVTVLISISEDVHRIFG